MKIGIIGTGAIGSTLAEKLSNSGHQVKVTNTRDIAELSKLAERLGANAASLQDVVKDVAIIIFSIPFNAYKDLPKDLLQDVPQEVIIMDTSNYAQFRDGELEGLAGKTDSEYISEILGRPVVKVFNNAMAYTLKHKGKAVGEEGRLALAIAANDEEHKKVAAELVNQTGFDAVDGGSLAQSWRQEAGTPAFCTDLNAVELEQALNQAEKGKAPRVMAYIMGKLMNAGQAPTHEEIVALNRSAVNEVK